MIKKVGSIRLRYLAVALAGLFALLVPASNSARVSALDDADYEIIEACFEMPLDADVAAGGGKKRDEQIKAINDCIRPTGATINELIALCSSEGYQDSISAEKCEGALGRRPSTDPETYGKLQEGAADPEDNKCVSNVKAIAWFACPLIDSASYTITRTYANIIEDWLYFEPRLLTDKASSGTNSVYGAWSAFRGLANIVFVILMLVIIYAHVTGIETQNYRRAIPRLLALVLMVNISYYVCQAVIDLSNILGNGIGRLLMGWSERINLSNLEGLAGISMEGSITTAVVLALVWGIVGSLSVGPAFFTPIMFAILSAVLAVLSIFVMLVVRQALIILLTITAPIAIALAALPNTSSVYRKWFGLFKKLLITYPLASVLFYGGNFAGRLVMQSWDNGGFVAMLVSLAICVLPITMLPKLSQSTVAAIDRLTLKAKGGLNHFVRNRFENSRTGKRFEEIKRGKAVRRAAMSYYDKKSGELKKVKIFGYRPPSADYNFQAASNDFAREQRVRMQQNNNGANGTTGTFEQMENYSAVRAAEMQLSAMSDQSVGSLSAVLDNAINCNNDRAMAAAATRRLFDSGELGQAAIMDTFERSSFITANEEAMRAACGALYGYGDSAKKVMPKAYAYSRAVTASPGGTSVGDYSTYRMTNSSYSGLTGEKLQAMNAASLREIADDLPTRLSAGSGSQDAANDVISSARLALKTQGAEGLTGEKRAIIEKIAKMQN